ncbi:MAG: thiamine-monophosphate kinase [Mariniblastus sp.]|jgi:thiamine-monophosphate kinase
MEHDFHCWLKKRTLNHVHRDRVQVGMGDDGAVLAPSNLSIVVVTDTIAEGTHFDLSQHDLSLVGRKALAVNLSDLAAMGAQPSSAVLTFMLPRNWTSLNFPHQSNPEILDADSTTTHAGSTGLIAAKQIYQGINKIAEEFDVAIIGGDTNTWNGPLVVGATVMGYREPTQTGWSIGGVQPGDKIVVSGSFGGSIHGRHLSFTPRVKLANYLVEHYAIGAATDASDSLSLDLATLASSSNVGINLDLHAIPISSDVRASEHPAALHHALTDGEDFELILAVCPAQIDRLMADNNLPCKLTVIGTATETHRELRTLDHHGKISTFTPKGYIH